MRLFCFFMMFWVMLSYDAKAAIADFADFFEIDLEKDKLPKTDELNSAIEKYDEYNRKYDSFYDLLGDFDSEFHATIAGYGMQEKRMKGIDEDLYIEFLRNTPKKYYQYIGPQLFEVPNMSEKVLNYPGIKETKNKFPTRIAEQVKDIEDLEFMSPSFYFFLMPEAWPGYQEEVEYPKMVRYHPKIVYDKNFYAAIKRLVKPEKYMPGYKDDGKKSKSDLRTLRPTKDSLLTSADIKAFIATIDDVDEWAKQPENEYLLSKITIQWTTMEKEQGIGKYVPAGLKDLVHPCARFVQKIRIAGKEKELVPLIANEGFTVNEWAYTCDKTIKAYRVANVRKDVVRALREFQLGIYDEEIKGMSPFTQNVRFATMQSIIQAHKAPLSDVIEYKKNRNEFETKLQNRGFSLFGHPINRY